MTVAVLRNEVTRFDGGTEDVVCRALLVWCPGCEQADLGGLHRMVVERGPAFTEQPTWEWDGNLESPTLNPSILVTSEWGGENPGKRTCHSYIRAGVWEYLGDCTHPLAGQHVPLPELPEWVTARS